MDAHPALMEGQSATDPLDSHSERDQNNEGESTVKPVSCWNTPLIIICGLKKRVIIPVH